MLILFLPSGCSILPSTQENDCILFVDGLSAYAQTKYSSLFPTVTMSFFSLNLNEIEALSQFKSSPIKYLVLVCPLAEATIFNLSG